MQKLILYVTYLSLFGPYCYSSTNAKNRNLRQDLYGKYAKHFPADNAVFYSSPKKVLQKDELFFAVEIPQGENLEFELRRTSGSMIMKHKRCPRPGPNKKDTILNYPINYGIVPGHFDSDGDPFELLVLGNPKKYAQMVKRKKIIPQVIKVVGILKMEECLKLPCVKSDDWEEDWKILGVDIKDPKYAKISQRDDFPKALKERLTTFFSYYIAPRTLNGTTVRMSRVTGFLDKTKTLEYLVQNLKPQTLQNRLSEIKNCHQMYQKIMQSKVTPAKNLDIKFLRCLFRVHYKDFFPSSPNFRRLIQYALYQYLIKLNHPGASFKDAIKQMQERKQQKKTYYRYVTFDQPNPPGSGQAIFELIKTADRNRGCPDNFPSQHYENRPILDLSSL